MTPNLQDRLRELEQELARGQSRLAHLDAERDNIARQILRIEGAITLARELSAPPVDAELAETA